MIHLERGAPPPGYSARAKEALAKLRSFFKRSPQQRAQQKPPFDSRVRQPAKLLLAERFHGKCAYCESMMGTPVNFESFRPKSLYWWLAYEWENTLVACQKCNMAKAARFPLEDESKRATKPGDEDHETPLLLDPCKDRPQEHLVFSEDGEVFSDTRRGMATIDTLALNRQALVEARRNAIRNALSLLLTTSAKDQDLKNAASAVRKHMEPPSEYSAAVSQIVARRLGVPSPEREQSKKLADLQGALQAQVAPLQQAAKNVDSARSAYQAHEREVESFAITEAGQEAGSNNYFAKLRTIERIEIRNFKALRDLHINLAAAPESASSWLMLLGENATGKSSILKAVALALMGDQQRTALGVAPNDVLTHGTEVGHVRVWLTGASTPTELGYKRGAPAFQGQSAEKVLLLGYGATRLLPRDSSNGSSRGFVRVGNLFDPLFRLIDAQGWLAGLEPVLFDQAAGVLKDMLPLGKQDRLEAEGSRVSVRMFGHVTPLYELSDGYQSVLALAADILSVLLPVWKKRISAAEGIVLIDELDAHLHPTWRMQIVETLRECFPHVQFITTSHDPLCLKGLRAGEVVVLKRNRKKEIAALADLPSPEGMSADQLLTSEHFGLGSTVEREIQKLFEKYYALLARKRLSPSQARELGKLKARLAELNHMGRTRREQLLLEVVDAYLAEDPSPGREAQETSRNRMLERLTTVWTGRPPLGSRGR